VIKYCVPCDYLTNAMFKKAKLVHFLFTESHQSWYVGMVDFGRGELQDSPECLLPERTTASEYQV
jgi:hypothetical protein